MLVSKLLRRSLLLRGAPLQCTRHRHPDTKPSDQTLDVTPEQELISLPLRKPRDKAPSYTLVHERPQVGTDHTQPRRKVLLRPRWPQEFIIEPVQQCKYALVALETATVGPRPMKAVKEFITANIKRDKDSLFVRSYPDYPMSRIPLHTRHGEGKNKVEEYLDYVMAGRVLFEFDCDTPFQTIIYRGSFKRLNIALMLVKGEDHRYPAKVTDTGGRDRLGLKIYNYEIEYANGTKTEWKLPEHMSKDHQMRLKIMQKSHLDYSHMKHKSFGNEREDRKFGTPH